MTVSCLAQLTFRGVSASEAAIIYGENNLRHPASERGEFGQWQFSVFLCRLTATDLIRLKRRLYDLIDLKQDQVLFFPLCNRCTAQVDSLGRPPEPYNARDVVIIA